MTNTVSTQTPTPLSDFDRSKQSALSLLNYVNNLRHPSKPLNLKKISDTIAAALEILRNQTQQATVLIKNESLYDIQVTIHNRVFIHIDDSQIGKGRYKTCFLSLLVEQRGVLPMAHLEHPFNGDTKAEFVANKEFSIIATLKKSNVTTVANLINTVKANNFAHYYYELAQYGTLQYFVGKIVLPNELKFNFTKRICLMLHELNDIKLCHGDIKPGNLLVFLDQTGHTLKLSDFSHSRYFTNGPSKRGTERFLAPEQTENGTVIPDKVDPWQAGCTIWFLWTGRQVPWQSLTSQSPEWHKCIENFHQNLMANTNPAFQLLAKLLEPNPKNRISGKEALTVVNTLTVTDFMRLPNIFSEMVEQI